MRLLTLALAFFFCLNSYAQYNYNLDSLKRLIFERSEYPADTLLHDRYVFLAKEYQKSQLDSSHYFFQQAWQLARQLNDTLRMITDLRDRGNNYMQRGPEYATQALDDLRRAYFLAKYYDSEEIGSTTYWLVDLGNVYYSEDIYSIARSYYQAAEAEFAGRQDTFGVILSYRNIALTYQYDGARCDSARHYFQKALDLQKAYRPDDNSMMQAYNYMSLGYFCDDQHDMGLEYLEKTYALALANNIKETNPRYWAKINHNIASNYVASERLEEARPYLEAFQEMLNRYPDLERIFTTHKLLLQQVIAQDAKNYSKALDITLEIIERDQLPSSHLAKQYKLVAKYYQALGQPDKALEAKDKYIDILKENTKDKFADKVVKMYAAMENYEQQRALELKELALEKERVLKEKQTELNQLYTAGLIGLTLILLLLALLLQRLWRQKRTIAANANALQKLNQTKDKLMSILAHDLRGPFGHIQELGKQLYVQLSQRPTKSDLQRKALSLHQAAKGSYLLFEDLLSWSKNQSGDLRFAPESVHLSPLLEEVYLILQSQLEHKRLEIQENLEIVTFKADPDMLRTLLRNLLSNAVKASPPKSSLEIRTWTEDGTVYLAIKDEAGGIPQAQQATLFDEDRWKQRRGNSGLGLVLCRQFMERHGGQISLDSMEGQGSTFTLHFPDAFLEGGATTLRQQRQHQAQSNLLSEKQQQQLYPLLDLELSQATAFLRLRQQLPGEESLQNYLEQWQTAILAQDEAHFNSLRRELEGWLGISV